MARRTRRRSRTRRRRSAAALSSALRTALLPFYFTKDEKNAETCFS